MRVGLFGKLGVVEFTCFYSQLCLAPQAFVSTSSVSLGSATGKTSLTALRLLFPQNPLRWAFAGTLRITSEKSRQKRRLNLRFKDPFRELRRWRGRFHTPNFRSFGNLIYAGYLDRLRLPRSVKQTGRWPVCSVGHSGYAARRQWFRRRKI